MYQLQHSNLQVPSSSIIDPVCPNAPVLATCTALTHMYRESRYTYQCRPNAFPSNSLSLPVSTEKLHPSHPIQKRSNYYTPLFPIF